MNWTRISLHLLFWVVYLPLNSVVNCNLNQAPINDFFITALGGEAFSLPVKLMLVYTIFYYIIPQYSERNKVGKLVGLTLLVFFLALLLYRLSVAWIYFPIFHPEAVFEFFNPKGITLTAFDLFITLAAAVPIKLIRLHYKSLEFEQELIREKLESELHFLRAQTNPHFLFNTLNNLFVLSRKKSDVTPDAIMMLSKIMRFMLHDCRAPRIPISNEVRVIRDYIELECLRYNDRLIVDYQEDIDNSEAQIAPLMLLPFVENSFKHGAGNTTGKVVISVHLRLKEQLLHFLVKNTMDADAPAAAVKSGIGLDNVKRQLELIYPGRHRLDYGPRQFEYSVELSINLGE
jgi:two-component system, LytTR family, sensor kinase